MATVVLTALAYAATGALRAMTSARLNQQAADIATQQIEDVRAMPWGAIGHDPSGIAPDPNLAGDDYQVEPGKWEPLVKVAGGIRPQITQVTVNEADYTVYTYITKPAEAQQTDNRRVTVVVEWMAYDREWSKTVSTMVTLTQRGLPLPEYKLTQVGPSTITVNPGAVAAFGYQVSNQGAPNQWNITTTLAGAALYLDDGDGTYNPAVDTTLLQDSSGDGIPDTGRLDPTQSRVFWVVVTPQTPDPGRTFSVTATPSGLGTETGRSVQSTLIVVEGVIVGPSPSSSDGPPLAICDLTGAQAAPIPAAAPGYNVRAYTLHNSGVTSWPEFPLPTTGPIPGSPAIDPLYFDMSPPSIPSDRALPPLSTDLQPAGEPGRVLYPGGSATSTAPSQVLRFVSRTTATSYRNSAVVRMWVRPVTAGDPVRLEVQVDTVKASSGARIPLATSVPLTLDPFTCEGWQEFWVEVPLPAINHKKDELLGVRVWNPGGTPVALAYDHASFPATVTVVEK